MVQFCKNSNFKKFSKIKIFAKNRKKNKLSENPKKMTKNLVIVESPAKAKTIEKYLGKDFVVKSSFGHIRDLPSKGMGVDIEGGTFEPEYEITADKKKTVAELKKFAKNREVWLATDEDREGEAISWHVCEALKLDPKTTKRIVFHEITKPALVEAVKNPRTVDQNLVDAQQARRILDRIVGYEISPVLWRKIKTGLSAGRVQSVAVRIIVEREREIHAFEPKISFRVIGTFKSDEKFDAELDKRFDSEKSAKNFLEKCLDAKFTVESVEKKEGTKNPSPPFTTSTLQQAASSRLGFSVKRTMFAAQKLYEAGKTTYMRTDSVNLSDTAIGQAIAAIEKNFGKKYLETRKFKTRSAGAQEAHEAIRPTNFAVASVSTGDSDQDKLYELIWKRAIASQMASAKIDRTEIKISTSATTEKFVAKGEVVAFDGFLKVYPESGKETILPAVKSGENLVAERISARESFSKHPPRFTEASLVKILEEKGIGRPSTYAPTISTIQDRKYVEKKSLDPQQRPVRVLVLADGKISEKTEQENFGAEKNKLFPTEIGEIVNDFCVKNFPEVLDYDFTARIEADFDEIAEGNRSWRKMLQKFYPPFHEFVEKSGGVSREEAGKMRELGKDPKSGKPVIARLGRFGPMIQIGTKDDDEKPKFASIPAGETIDGITLETALEQFKFPKLLGKNDDGEEIFVALGRFGPYIKCGKMNASLKRETRDRETGEIIPGDDPGSITLARAKQLIAEKIETEKNRIVAEWPKKDIALLRGRYGIYIKHGKKNVRIPKTVEKPEKLTLADCEKLIAEAPEKKGRWVGKKKS